MRRVDSQWQINRRAGFFYLAILLSGLALANDEPLQLELQLTTRANRDMSTYTLKHGRYVGALMSSYTPRDPAFYETSVLRLIGHAATDGSFAEPGDLQSVALRGDSANAWVSALSTPQSFDEWLDYLKPRWTSLRAEGDEFSSLEPQRAAPSAALTAVDALLMGLVGVGLVAYQLRRKQRSLRQSPFALP